MNHKTLSRILQLQDEIIPQSFKFSDLEPENSDKYETILKRTKGIITSPRYFDEGDLEGFIEKVFLGVPLRFQQQVIKLGKKYGLKDNFDFDFSEYSSNFHNSEAFCTKGRISKNDDKSNPWGRISDNLTSYLKYATHPESRIIIKLNEGGKKDQFDFDRNEAYFKEDLPNSQEDTLKIIEVQPSGETTILGLKYQLTPLEYTELNYYERDDYTLESVKKYSRILLVAQHLRE
jgi:hypothetical protein